MMRWIGIITVVVVLAKYPEKVIAGVNFSSYLAKIVWILSERTVKSLGAFYDNEVADKVEEAKKFDVTAP